MTLNDRRNSIVEIKLACRESTILRTLRNAVEFTHNLDVNPEKKTVSVLNKKIYEIDPSGIEHKCEKVRTRLIELCHEKMKMYIV